MLSLDNMLREAINNPNSPNKDPNLINYAILNNHFREAQSLINTNYPSSKLLPNIIVERLCSPITTNKDGFKKLLGYSLIQGHRYNQILLSIPTYPHENIKYIILITLYEIKSSNEPLYMIVHQNISNEIPQILDIKPKQTCLSELIYSHYMLTKYTCQIDKLKIPKIKPTLEFLITHDRMIFNQFLEKLHEYSIQFIEDKNPTQYINRIYDLANQNREMFKNLQEKIGLHKITMGVRLSFQQNLCTWSETSKVIINDFINPTLSTKNPNDIKFILESMENYFFSQYHYNYSFLLIFFEIHQLLKLKMENFKKASFYDKLLGQIQKQFLSFENNLKLKHNVIYNACYIFPQICRDNLYKDGTETKIILQNIGKMPNYFRYLLVSSFLEKLAILESRYYLNMIDETIDIDEVPKNVLKMNSTAAYMQEMLNGIPFSAQRIDDLTFDENYVKWAFPKSVHLDDILPGKLFNIFFAKLKLLTYLIPHAKTALSNERKCKRCQKALARQICLNCMDVQTCNLCSKQNCPVCDQPMNI